MCLSPDGNRLYLGEMLAGRILVYDYEVESGDVRNRRVFAEMAEEDGMPGGLAVDGEGFVWCAHWGGWRVTRYAPDGAVDLVIPLPVSIVTGVGFGGEGFGDLFVTTAFFGLSDEERENQPQAGDLFRVRTGTRGIAESEFMESPNP
jgi:L-arabinonolactonase